MIASTSLLATATATATTPPRRRRRVLLLVLDGMRPGSIEPKLMPNLARLAAGGVTYTRSRTGFPSETMVGAGELFTGAYPDRSGITSNWMILPGQDRGGVELKTLDGIKLLERSYDGRATTSPSVFEQLGRAGLTSAVIGKEGPAELAWAAGATWTVSSGGAHETTRGAEVRRARGAAALDEVARTAGGGEAPKSGEHDDAARSRWLGAVAAAVDAAYAPDLLTVWLTDPDKTQHNHGLGTANQRTALQQADAAVGRLLADLERTGSLADTDVVVTSDHGFSEHLQPRDGVPLDEALRAAGLDVSHVVAAGNQHLVRFAHAPTAADFRRLREVIAASPFAHLVRTVIENPRDGAPGDRRDDARLTGADLRQGTTRSADAYVIYRRDDHGVPGRRRSGGRGPAHVPAHPGTTVAGHGSMGWSDLNNTLVVAGPSFERARAGATPIRTRNAAGIVDVAPTILHLFGLAPAEGMAGRVLLEALAEPGGGDGEVAALRSRLNTAWADVQLGARLVRTGLVTEQLADGSSYFVGLEATDA